MAGGKMNALKLRTLSGAGRYGDGDGLWLQVRDADHRSWLYRFMIAGKPRQLGLGPFPDVSLANARKTSVSALCLPDLVRPLSHLTAKIRFSTVGYIVGCRMP